MTSHLRLPGPTSSRLEGAPQLTPFIKWPGGKSSELPTIAGAAPPLGGRLIDPFVGGGSVLLATPAEVPAWANDACADLIGLYTASASADEDVRRVLDGIAAVWLGVGREERAFQELADVFEAGDDHLLPSVLAVHESRFVDRLEEAGPGLVGEFGRRLRKDLATKFRRTRVVQAEVGRAMSRRDLVATVEGSVRAAMYMAIRARYNTARLADAVDAYRLADFFFLREFAYAAMFRFNDSGAFNVPYGGKTYNRKSFADKVAALFHPEMRRRLQATTWRSIDFATFLEEATPAANDFVFVDPPYDSDFSAYDGLEFGWQDQVRLKDHLESIPAHVMVVIADTPMIRELYTDDRWRISEASKTYMWTIKSRNDRAATHLTIVNY